MSDQDCKEEQSTWSLLSLSVIRAGSLIMLGGACSWLALLKLGVEMDSDFLLEFAVLPIGVLLIVAAICSLAWQYIHD